MSIAQVGKVTAGGQATMERKVFLSVVAALGLSLVFLFARGPSPSDPAAPEVGEGDSLVQVQTACGGSPADAQKRGALLEHVANAQWERVPFDPHEAPEAVVQMGLAERCFVLSADRDGRMRVEARRRTFERELEARFERARLQLEMARRAGNHELTLRHTQTLLALLSRSGEALAPYRAWLESLARKQRATLVEQQAIRGQRKR